MRHKQKVSVLLVAFVLYEALVRIDAQTEYKVSPIDVSALREIKNSLTEIPTNAYSSKFFQSWDFSSPDPCSTFSGIICSSNPPLQRVISLTLGTGLAGSLSPSILKLTELTQLVLLNGIVTGPIPPKIGTLKKLRVISLSHNRLTGPIPDSICYLEELHTLDLSFNFLTAQLPQCISKLSRLRVMLLSSNRFNGQLPPQLPCSLFHLDLKANAFSGFLPTKMPLSLRYLSASGNRLTGPLNVVEPLTELEYLDLSSNGLSGPIPASLFRPTLTTILLQRNNLSGGVPAHVPIYVSTSTSTVDLSHNYLTGELTPIFAGVETLFLNNNQFGGGVPKEYVESLAKGSTTTLYLQHNYFTGFPLDSGLHFPESVALCLSYNCFRAFLATTCPSTAGNNQLSRPAIQCHAKYTSNQLSD